MIESLAAIPTLLAALIVRTDRRLIASLRDAGALSPPTAVTLDLTNPLARWRLARLSQGGAIGSSATGRVFLDATGFASYRRRRRRRLLLMLVSIAPLVAVIVWALGGT